jgi:hypothetical protein
MVLFKLAIFFILFFEPIRGPKNNGTKMQTLNRAEHQYLQYSELIKKYFSL